MNEKQILILGAGVGGLVVANELRRSLPLQHGITLIEKNPHHHFAPSFLWLMTGDRTPEQITRNVDTLVRPGIRIVFDEALAIDTTKQQVITSTSTYSYNYLIIALGAELAPEIIPGLAENAHTFYSIDGAKKLRPALDAFAGGSVAIVVSALPYKCPGAPHEGAMLIADYFRKRGLQDKVQIHLYTPETQPMPVAGPELGNAVTQMLASKNIAFHPLHKLVSVNPQARELFFDGKDAIGYELLVAIPPHRSPRVVRESGLTNEAGWIPVDRSTLKTKHENVFAIGDVTTISIPGRWKPDVSLMLPKAGVFAHLQAEVVAHHIAEDIKGKTSTRKFPGIGYCMLEAGEELAGFAYGDFFAEPSPQLKLHKVGKAWHIGKVLFEKWWLAPFGLKRSLLRATINLGTKMMKIPVHA